MLDDWTIVLVAAFLIFFRGKMMHDDHLYFADIDDGLYHGFRGRRIHLGLMLGYVSWLLWAPAIYYLTEWRIFGLLMGASILLSTFWAALDEVPKNSSRFSDKKHFVWIVSNAIYMVLFCMIAFADVKDGWSRFAGAVGLLFVLCVDWLYSKPLASLITPAQNDPPPQTAPATPPQVNDPGSVAPPRSKRFRRDW